jgi:hypothetical protein
MQFDLNTLFSGTVAANGTRAGQAITATAISTNVIDTRVNGAPASVDLGMYGRDLWLDVVIPVAFNNLTSLQIELISDSNSNMTTSPVSHFSKTILLAALAAGANPVRVQVPSDDYKEFLAVRYTVVGTAPTAGTVIAFLTLDAQRNVGYPSGYTLDV